MTPRRNMNDPIRVAMVGTSWYADLAHLPILKSHPQAQVAAICGRNRARADEIAGKFGVPQVFTDYEVMFRQCELDAAVIAVPDELWLRWQIPVEMGSPAWAGVLGDLGSHMIDMARLTVGDIAHVQAHLAVQVERPHPEAEAYPPACDSANLMLAFENGAMGLIQLSAVAQVGEEKFISLHGDAGVLEVDFGFASPFVVRGKRHDEDAMRELPIPEDFLAGIDIQGGWYDRFIQMFTRQPVGTHHFIDCIAGDLPATPDFHEGMKTQAVIEAAFESHQRGCWAQVTI